MHYLIAFDKFKGAITAPEAAAVATKAIQQEDPAAGVKCAPLTDGGEGFASILATALGGELCTVQVPGPRFDPVAGKFALISESAIPAAAKSRLKLPESLPGGKVAFVEMASASGYECLQKEDRDPWRTTTMGTGALIKAAVEAGAEAVVLGIGGSATNDCGAGALEALGVVYYDRDLQAVTQVTPAEFKRINTVGSTSHLIDKFPPVRIACDVSNPLLGESGATRIFGPQKGLREEDFERMERTLRKMACRILGLFGTDPTQWDALMAEPGSGAAGGIGFALRHALPDSAFVEGFPLVAELLDLQTAANRADVIFTGEGRLDPSSLDGKGPTGLLRLVNPRQKVVFFCGSADPETVDLLCEKHPNLKVIPISNPDWTLDKALSETTASLHKAVTSVVSSH